MITRSIGIFSTEKPTCVNERSVTSYGLFNIYQYRMTKWLDYFLNLCLFTAMKICPIAKNCKE